MGLGFDINALLASAVSGQTAIAWGLFGTLMLGYWIMSLKVDRHHVWRRDRTNLGRLPIWRCKRCGMTVSHGGRRSGSVCDAS